MKRNEFDFNHIESHFILFFQMFYQSREIFQNKSSDRYWWAFVCVVFWSVGSWIKLGNLAFAIQAEDTKQTLREYLFLRVFSIPKRVCDRLMYLAKFYTAQYLCILCFFSHSRRFFLHLTEYGIELRAKTSFKIRYTED